MADITDEDLAQTATDTPDRLIAALITAGNIERRGPGRYVRHPDRSTGDQDDTL